MDRSMLNMKFYPYYLTGSAIEVRLVGGGTRCGTVGVSQGNQPVFWLISSNRKQPICELCYGCKVIGLAIKKTRIDSPGYLKGDKPTFILRRRGNVPFTGTGAVGNNC